MSPPRLPSTCGRPLREKRAGGFRLLEVVHDARLQLSPHSHDNPSLCCVLNGGFEEWIDGTHFAAGPSCLLVEPREAPHHSDFGPTPTRSLILEVEAPELAERLGQVGPLLDVPALLSSPRLSEIGLRLQGELHLADAASELAVEGLALELVAAASRLHDEDGSRYPPAWLNQVADQLRDRFRDALDIDSLASEAGVHPVHLSRSFRKHFGESLGEHVRRLRLDWCAQRLRRSDDAVAAIATQAGFCDQSHMARFFKRIFGCAPSHYRRMHRR